MPNQVAAPPNPFTPEAVEEPYGVHEALRAAGVVRIPDTDMFAISRYEPARTASCV